jgi:GNAT superfamily N-acetyltransferase
VDYQDNEQVSVLIDLLNHYANDPMGGGKALSEEVRKTLPEKLANFPGAFSFIVYVDGKPAAFTNCLMGFSTFKAKPLVNIHDLAVHGDYRGRGLSHVLLEAVEKEARERGCCKVTLEVLSGNDIAQQSYRKFGFNGYELDAETGQALFWEKPL